MSCRQVSNPVDRWGSGPSGRPSTHEAGRGGDASAPPLRESLLAAFRGFRQNRLDAQVPHATLLTVKQMFYVFLWPHPGMEQALVAYEDAVLALVGEHRGEVVAADRSPTRTSVVRSRRSSRTAFEVAHPVRDTIAHLVGLCNITEARS